jgi:hypothetical protein
MVNKGFFKFREAIVNLNKKIENWGKKIENWVKKKSTEYTKGL